MLKAFQLKKKVVRQDKDVILCEGETPTSHRKPVASEALAETSGWLNLIKYSCCGFPNSDCESSWHRSPKAFDRDNCPCWALLLFPHFPLAAPFHTFTDVQIYSHYWVPGAAGVQVSLRSLCRHMLIWAQSTSPRRQRAASFDNFDMTCINMSWRLLHSWQVWHFLRAKKRHSWNPASYCWLSAISSVLSSLVMQNQVVCLQNLINSSASHICNRLTWLQ